MLGKISARESNHRLQACRGFVRWAMQLGLLNRDPLISLTPVNARIAPVLVRRALRFEELRTLVQTAHDGPEYRGVSGPVRALVWRLSSPPLARARRDRKPLPGRRSDAIDRCSPAGHTYPNQRLLRR